ncbi:MAG: biotin--[acetyl-CoA-carboxylase] ligase [Selenomonadaceae bacterium]|nr:biotin--[acetyl-CoA-carboxylase] ligase [Selenomonadaceae bacterium]
MRKTIVEILKNAGTDFISGESIAGELGISRTAVWKHIQKLRDSGYEIISRERRGYNLKDAPDLLLPSEIQIGLDTKIIANTTDKMYYYPAVESTNHEAKALAYHGAQEGTIIVAEEQSGGKGRLERNFYSPRGKGIWFSVILRPNFPPYEASKFTLMAAVAVAEAMARFNLKAEIKWPNDILFEGRKIVGILTEMSGEIGKINYIVIGVGINVNISHEDFPEDIRSVAASLSEMNGAPISRVKFFRAVLEEFDKLYLNVITSGFDDIINLWRKYNITLGKDIRVITMGDNGESYSGKAVDLDKTGALIVETEQGLRTVYAGDVSIRNLK